MLRDLQDDVRAGAEPVQRDGAAARHRGQPQRPVPDDARAEQRGGLGVGERRRDRVGVVGAHDRVLGVAAVEVVAGVARRGAEVLGAARAVGAYAARRAEPRDPDAIPGLEARHVGTDRIHCSDHLVARNQRSAMRRQIGLDDVEVGAADAADVHANTELAGAGLGQRDLGLDERTRMDRRVRRQQHRSHAACLPCPQQARNLGRRPRLLPAARALC